MDRDSQGRFLKGAWKGGPGRPAKAREKCFADCVKRAVSVADVCAILKKAVEDARKGDSTAQKLILSYVLGVPADSVVEARLAALEHGEPQRIFLTYEDTPSENPLR